MSSSRTIKDLAALAEHVQGIELESERGLVPLDVDRSKWADAASLPKAIARDFAKRFPERRSVSIVEVVIRRVHVIDDDGQVVAVHAPPPTRTRRSSAWPSSACERDAFAGEAHTPRRDAPQRRTVRGVASAILGGSK